MRRVCATCLYGSCLKRRYRLAELRKQQRELDGDAVLTQFLRFEAASSKGPNCTDPKLGVEGIVEGSVERSGNRVHMTVQLIHAATDTHLWAESYDRDANEAYRLASELSETIARKLRIPTPAAGSLRYVSPEAHDAYLRGRGGICG